MSFHHPRHFTVVGFKKTIDRALSPKRATKYSAGLDLRAPADYLVPAHSRKMIDSGIRLYLPQNTYARVAGISNLALNHFIVTIDGVVDLDYTSSIKVVLANHSDIDYNIMRGDKIAQIIIEKIFIPKFVEIKETSNKKRSIKAPNKVEIKETSNKKRTVKAPNLHEHGIKYDPAILYGFGFL